MISSNSNPRIKTIRRLLADRRFRRREGAFVVEGNRWLAELAHHQARPRLLLVSEAWIQDPANQALSAALGTETLLASEAVLAHASDTETPQGALAVVPIDPKPWPPSPSLILILDAVANPGNLGTMLRSAAAAGVDGVILAPGCVDAYNPKVVRGGMGAHLRLPIVAADWNQISQMATGLQVWLAAAGGETVYDRVDWRLPSALIIGSEASGAGRQAQKLAYREVSIPMAAATESLNAAVAAGIILFEAARQRARSGEE